MAGGYLTSQAQRISSQAQRVSALLVGGAAR
jgi:hypothetical protein